MNETMTRKGMFKLLANMLLVNLIIGILMLIFLKKHWILEESVLYFIDTVFTSIVCFIVTYALSTGHARPYVGSGFNMKVSLKRWLPISILVGLGHRILIELAVNIQLSLGFPLNIGKNQGAPTNIPLDDFLTSGLIAPLYEEFLFKILLFSLIAAFIDIFAKKTKVSGQNVYHLNSKLGWVAIILTSILFSWIHLPDASSFYLYASGGIITGILYLKYGYWAAVVEHSTFNYLSLVTLELLIQH